MYLYNNNVASVYDHPPPSYEGSTLELKRFLNTIHDIGFVNRSENKQRSLGANTIVYDYWISSKGIQFIESIPSGEFTNKPYSYYLYLEDNKENLSMQKLRGDVDVLTNTLVDYDKTKALAKYAIILAAVAAIAALGQLLLSLK